MVKLGHKDRNIGILIFIIAVLVVLLIIFIPKGSKQVESLTENDFKILNAAWDTSMMNWKDNELVPDPVGREYNWSLICNCQEKPCTTSAWHITTQASRDLLCENIIDGINDEDNITLGSGKVISAGVKSINFVEGQPGNIYTNFDVTRNHEIIVCCKDMSGAKRGETCDSVALSPKC